MPEPKPQCAPFDLDGALDEIEQTGCTVAAYTRQRGFPSWKLYEELRRRRQCGRAKAEPVEPEFVSVRLTPAGTSSVPFELVLEGGRTLRIPGTFDESSLQRLVRTLETC